MRSANLFTALADRRAVDDMASRVRQEGVTVIDGPRATDDGYDEAVLLDPEGNRVEIVAGDYRLPT